MANSFQVATKSRMKSAASAGIETGRKMRRKMVKCEAPSISAASLSSFGTFAEEAVKDEHLIGHAEGDVGQDDAWIRVD